MKEAKGHCTHFAALASQHVGGERTVAAAAAAAARRRTDAAPGAGACACTLLIIQALAAQKGQIIAAASAARRCASGPCSRAGRWRVLQRAAPHALDPHHAEAAAALGCWLLAFLWFASQGHRRSDAPAVLPAGPAQQS